MGYRVNSKVFDTEAEAISFSKDLMSRGGLGGWSETDEPVTHYYLGDGLAEPIEDFFGLIAEHKRKEVR